MSILTAEQLRTSWLQGISGTGEDTTLALFIQRASARIARYLGYPPATAGTAPTVESASYTRYFGSPDLERGDRILRLDVLPVTAVASIYDDDDYTWGADTLIPSADYSLFNGDEGLVLLKATATHAFTPGDQNLKVAFTAGFSTIPADLVQAVGQLSREYWLRRSTQGWESVPQGAGSATPRRVEDDIPPEVRNILDPFRLPRALL